MRLIVTGASGYIGSHLAAAARRHACPMIGLSRKPCPDTEVFSFHLQDSFSFPLQSRDVVVHLAAQTGFSHLDKDMELRAAASLLNAAHKSGAHLIFVSSLSAGADAPTFYGRNKWNIERLVLEAGQTVVRFGLIYGGTPQGLYDGLLKKLKLLPAVPRFIPEPSLQMLHINDATDALMHVAGNSEQFKGGCLSLAYSRPVPLHAVLKFLAWTGLQRHLPSIPVPLAWCGGMLSLLVRCRVMDITWKHRFNSALRVTPVDTSHDMTRLGLRAIDPELEQEMARA